MIRVIVEHRVIADGVHIPVGDYADHDERLRGLSDYLVSAGHAVRVSGEGAVAAVPAPKVNVEFAPDADHIDAEFTEPDDLSALTRAELFNIANDVGCDVTTRTTKAALIEAIEEVR